MNEHSDSTTEFDQRLDQIAREDRSEPDSAFEDRIWHAMQQPDQDRIPGRRRKSTAWIPFVTAACVGIMGYIVWMPMINVDMGSKTAAVASAESESYSTEILLSSFDAMDMLIADVDDMDESLSLIRLQIDAAEIGLASETDWQDLGGAL